MDTKYYQKHSLLRIFLGYFKPHRRLFAADMLCALLVAAVDLAFPLVSRWSMNNLLPHNAYSVFFAVMGTMAAAYLIRAFLYFVICYWGHTFGIRVEADIRRDLFRHMQTLGCDRAEIRQQDALALLASPPSEPFDLVFVDPPFHQELLEPACAALEQNGWLSTDALIYTESESAPEQLCMPANWQAHRQKKAGQVWYSLWQRG